VLVAAGSLALAGCGGSERQDASEPEGEFALDVIEASFPAEQRLAETSTMRIVVRNDSNEVAPHIAVTVKSDSESGSGPAFAERVDDAQLSDPSRPVWVVDEEPDAAFVAHTNTWAFPRVGPGDTAEFEWKVTAVQAGDYSLRYEVWPGLHGKSELAGGGTTSGAFQVSVDGRPPDARVDGDGDVVREEPAN
jgi:hypothetical protein